MLIFDGHASYITTTTIQYYMSENIILLCLPPHTTHVLQPLNVSLFAPLATAYKANIRSITQLGASYSVDKVNFLEQYQKARVSAFTILNIRKAWEKTGLVPYNPALILDQFPTSSAPSKSQAEHYSVTIRPSTPNATLNYSGPDRSGKTLITPKTTLQVHSILKKAKEGEDVEVILEKVGKAANLAIAEATIQERTNADLLDLHHHKEKKKDRTKGHYGNAKILNSKLIRQRLAEEEWKDEWMRIRILAPIIFKESRAATKRHQTTIASLQASSPQKKLAVSQKPQPDTKKISLRPPEQAPL